MAAEGYHPKMLARFRLGWLYSYFPPYFRVFVQCSSAERMTTMRPAKHCGFVRWDDGIDPAASRSVLNVRFLIVFGANAFSQFGYLLLREAVVRSSPPAAVRASSARSVSMVSAA